MNGKVIYLREHRRPAEADSAEPDILGSDNSPGSDETRTTIRKTTEVRDAHTGGTMDSRASFRSAAVAERIDVERIYGADEELEAGATVKFILACKGAASCLADALSAATTKDNFAADHRFMDFKDSLGTLIPFRSLSDGVGLVILTLLKIGSAKHLAHEIPQLMEHAVRGLNLIKNNPNLDFKSAMEFSDQLEAAAGEIEVPGYDVLASLLLDEDAVEE